jgi:regulator of sigma E protease
MNLVLAMVLYSATFMLGVPTPVKGPGAGIYYVAPDSPGAAVGLQPGDNILSIDGETVRDSQHAVELVQARLGQPAVLHIDRDGQPLTITVTPRVNPPSSGAIGISLDLPLQRQSYTLWQAVPLGVRTTFASLGALVDGIRATIRGILPFQISGPVGIYETTRQAAQTGVDRLLEFAAFLSVNLALLNLLPLPALDGGRLIFVLLELVRGGRRIAPEKEGLVHAMGMLALIGLMVVVTFFDVQRYWG